MQDGVVLTFLSFILVSSCLIYIFLFHQNDVGAYLGDRDNSNTEVKGGLRQVKSDKKRLKF